MHEIELVKSFHFSHAVLLNGEINLKVSLKGFPTPVTSALSMVTPQTSGKRELYVFSGRKNQQVFCSYTKAIGL